MFENLFNKNTTAVTTTASGNAAGLPSREAQTMESISTEETTAWEDKIRAAAPDDAVLLQLLHQAPTTPLKLAALEALQQEDSFRQAMHDFREQDKRL
ncbi:MAG TPA: hypothetical protein VK642_11670, partial [Burkholderiales bacterium]|nr:hypothetical protein [Burkholderiales bacterium]